MNKEPNYPTRKFIEIVKDNENLQLKIFEMAINEKHEASNLFDLRHDVERMLKGYIMSIDFSQKYTTIKTTNTTYFQDYLYCWAMEQIDHEKAAEALIKAALDNKDRIIGDGHTDPIRPISI